MAPTQTASSSRPDYLQQEELLSQEYKDLISTLPKSRGWVVPHLYNFQGFWYLPRHLQGTISCQKLFKPQDSDIFLVTSPKSGTTWLKSILFSLINRTRHVPTSQNHPLLNNNPHDLVPFLEINLYADNKIPDFSSSTSPRLVFSTHMPYVSLPESVKNNPNCKIVYLYRNPKDIFASLWHFTNKLRTPEMGTVGIQDAFERFCDGITAFGPCWDHALGYWKQSKENPGRILFLKFEDVKDDPVFVLRRLVEFLECPFSDEEEESGTVGEILDLCSFGNLSKLEVNKNGKLRLTSDYENRVFFRRGDVGGWKDTIDSEMAQKIDQITEEKFAGSGLVI